jgi:hypothetical protein
MQARALELRAVPAGATDSRTLEPLSSTCKQLPSPPHIQEMGAFVFPGYFLFQAACAPNERCGLNPIGLSRMPG